MRRLLAFAFLLVALVPAHAQTGTARAKAALSAEIASCFPNQQVGAITPTTVQACLQDFLASWQQYASVDARSTTSETIIAADYGQLVTFGNAAATAVTLPAANASGFFPFSFYASTVGAGTVTITPSAGLIGGASTLVLSQNQGAFIVSDGTNWQVVKISSSAVIINGGSINQLAYYASSGTALSPLGLCANGVYATNGSSAPSCSTTLPSALSIPSPTLTGTVTGPIGTWASGGINSAPIGQTTAAAGSFTSLGASGTLTFGILSPTSLGASTSTITGLSLNGSPNANNDYVPCYSASGGAIQKCTVGSIAGSTSAGVSSLGGKTGALGIDSTLQFTSTTLGINLANANTWMATQTFTANANNLTLNTPATSEVADIILASNGTNKWQIGKDLINSDQFYLYDLVANRYDIAIPTNGNMSLMPSGGNVLAGGNVYIGGGVPWVDVKSGANSCAAATGNGSTNDRVAIQCQINYAAPHDYPVFLPCGIYLVNGGGLTMNSNNYLALVGEQADCVLIEVTDDETAITLGTTSAHTWTLNLGVLCSFGTGATTDCVTVANNQVAHMHDCYITGGRYGLNTGGIDGDVYDCYIQGYTGNVISTGATWYVRDKLDNGQGQTITYAFYQQQSFAGATSAENHFVQTDFSDTFSGGGAAIKIDDRSSGGTSDNAFTICESCVISGQILQSNGVWLSLVGVEIGPSIPIASNNPISIVGSYGFNSLTVTGSGARSCAGNFNITC